MVAATVLGRWIQHYVPKLCKTGKYLSLMDIMHSPDAILVHLFSRDFLNFFFIKSVIQYYTENLGKSFFLSFLLSFLGNFIATTMRTRLPSTANSQTQNQGGGSFKQIRHGVEFFFFKC